MNKLVEIRSFLFNPVDNSPLVIFRIIFGLLLFLEAGGAIATGWVTETFVEPDFTMTFIGFEWLQPFAGNGMYYYYALMAAFGGLVMVGLFYRFAISAYTLMWTITYLMQKSHYNNHYYLLILICLLMIMCPAHRYLSFDVRRNPAIKSLFCPRWCHWIFIIQLFIVYTYASLSKMYPDWLQAEPLRVWFMYKSHFFLIGDMLQQTWFQFLVAYAGIFYDLLIVPIMLWRPTRMVGLWLTVIFHLANSAIFQIGIFPYLMIGMSLFFFPPDQIRSRFLRSKPEFVPQGDPVGLSGSRKFWTLVVGFYFLIQVFLPLRYHLYPGNVHWTEEGHRMSWKMMLRSKSGNIFFRVKDRSSEEIKIVRPQEFLSNNQTVKMATRPDMIWSFVQFLKKHLEHEGMADFEIYAVSNVSLNGKKAAPMIDPEVDLSKVEWKRFSHSEWILPLPEDESQD